MSLATANFREFNFFLRTLVHKDKRKGRGCYAPDPFLFSPGHYCKEVLRLDPDVRGYVASGVAHLVGAGGSSGFFTEVHVEVLVDLHAPLFGVAVDLE